MPQEEIQGERAEEARFRFDEAVIRGRGDGQLRVGEQAATRALTSIRAIGSSGLVQPHYETSFGIPYRSFDSCCSRMGLPSWSKSSAPMPHG